MNNITTYLQSLNQEPSFHLRRAVERLREGLFDPVAVRLLTVHEERLNAVLEQGFEHLNHGKSPHLCISGAYGQGKSHSLTYIQEKALQANYVTSMINLDLREIPLHDFKQVYRELIANIRFPDTDASLAAHWKKWVQARLRERADLPNGPADLLPEDIPHLFRSIMVGMTQKTISLSERQKQLKKHTNFRPSQFSYQLERALSGGVIPVNHLRNVFKYRQVAFYKEGSLSAKGIDIYLQMIQGLSQLFRQIGYQGWVLLFDEGESIAQVRITARSRSYQILDQLLLQSTPTQLYPIFAFTDDFFLQLEEEDYDRFKLKDDQEIPYFQKNYSEAWRDLTIYRLEDLSSKEWDELSEKLIHLYTKAYQWHSFPQSILPQMKERLTQLQGEETRYKLKALVDQLDVIHQAQIFS